MPSKHELAEIVRKYPGGGEVVHWSKHGLEFANKVRRVEEKIRVKRVRAILDSTLTEEFLRNTYHKMNCPSLLDSSLLDSVCDPDNYPLRSQVRNVKLDSGSYLQLITFPIYTTEPDCENREGKITNEGKLMVVLYGSGTTDPASFQLFYYPTQMLPLDEVFQMPNKINTCESETITDGISDHGRTTVLNFCENGRACKMIWNDTQKRLGIQKDGILCTHCQ